MLIHVPPGVRVLAMDVHKATISTGVLDPDATVPVVDKISSDDEAVRRLVGRVGGGPPVWACYEAGPTGYELARVLAGLGVRCEVIAPSLIPVRQGDRVKTDKRDARRLALLFRGGQLSAVRVPSIAEEAVRDLCRARADMVIDRTRARHRLGKFLLRHGMVWRGGDNWTLKHYRWLDGLRFEDAALRATFAHRHKEVLLGAPLDVVVDDLEGGADAGARRGHAPAGRRLGLVHRLRGGAAGKRQRRRGQHCEIEG